MIGANKIPLYSRADGARRSDRDVNEMLGVIRGIVCDGVVSEGEIFAFRNWLSEHPNAIVGWPGNVLAERIARTLEDGVVSASERVDLYELFCDTTGEGDIREQVPGSFSARLPFDDPAPAIVFPSNMFCFTGAFIYGDRSYCEKSTVLRGGECHRDVVQKPMTLVVGGHGNDAWIQSSFGRKIEKAMQYKQRGVPIAVVCEEHWTEAVMNAPVVLPS
jgi:hypothetical protein